MSFTEFPENLGQGPQGDVGPVGGFTLRYAFEAGTAAPPGSGKVRFNHATPASVTHIYVNDLDRDGADLQAFFNALALGDLIKIFAEIAPSVFASYRIAAVSNQSGYYDLTVVYVAGQGALSSYAALGIGFAKIGANADLFEARMRRDSATVLTLGAFKGNRITVGTDLVTLAADRSTTVGGSGDNRITNTGADAGAKTAADTTYYVYVSNSLPAHAPNSVRVSAQAPVLVNGVFYLGSSGDAVHWRFVGWIRTTSANELADSDTQRLVVNYYNRRWSRLFVCPGYSDDNAQTTYNFSDTTWVEANGAAKIEFIANGEDAVRYEGHLEGTHGSLSGRACVAVAEDVTTSIGVAGSDQAHAAGTLAPAHCGRSAVFASGHRKLFLMVRVDSGTFTAYADTGRNGAGADVAASYLAAEVMT